MHNVRNRKNGKVTLENIKNLNTFEYFTIFFLSHFNEIEQNVCLNFPVWLRIVFSSQFVIREEKNPSMNYILR